MGISGARTKVIRKSLRITGAGTEDIRTGMRDI
jgi:hypothetical protein